MNLASAPRRYVDDAAVQDVAPGEHVFQIVSGDEEMLFGGWQEALGGHNRRDHRSCLLRALEGT
jgi:hypothetical protein